MYCHRGGAMFIKSGDIISLGHYSRAFQIKTIVLDVQREISDDIISVKVIGDCAKENFLNDDPVVIGLEREKKVYMTSCYVVDVIPSQCIVKLAVNNEEFVVNSRAHERYPVSLYVDVLRVQNAQDSVAIAKNISYEGLMICSKCEFDEGENINIVLYLKDIEVKIGTKIMWKMGHNSSFEYGMKITYMDYNSQTVLWQYIDKLKNDQEEFVKQLKDMI